MLRNLSITKHKEERDKCGGIENTVGLGLASEPDYPPSTPRLCRQAPENTNKN